MPKLFTAKDFIRYNNPCFSCGGKIALKLGIVSLSYVNDVSYLPTIVSNDSIDINLHIAYYDNLTLTIFHKTNEFATNSINNLTMYLKNHHIFFQSYCDQCKSRIDSSRLQFDLMNDKVLALQIMTERLYLSDDKFYYNLISDFDAQATILLIDGKSKDNNLSYDMELPLLPKYSFNNRETLLKKIKTYMTFG